MSPPSPADDSYSGVRRSSDGDNNNSKRLVLDQTHEGEYHNDEGTTPISITKYTYLFAFCAAVNSCNLGYDIGVSTEAGKLVQDTFQLSTIQREVFLGSMNFWSSM